MEEIKLEYIDVAEYYMHLIRSGATEFTKPFNNLKAEGVTHNLSIQAVNCILDHKYNNKNLTEKNLAQIQEDYQEDKNKFDTKVKIFRYYSQAINSFMDEDITVTGIANNTGLLPKTIINFLAEYNEKLDLKLTPEQQTQRVRYILEKIWD